MLTKVSKICEFCVAGNVKYPVELDSPVPPSLIAVWGSTRGMKYDASMLWCWDSYDRHCIGAFGHDVRLVVQSGQSRTELALDFIGEELIVKSVVDALDFV